MRYSASCVYLISALCSSVFIAGAPLTGNAQDSESVAIVHVTVVDVLKGIELTDQTVIIRGHRIKTMGPGSHVQVPSGTRVVNGRGRFLVPGLWDMHAHFDGDQLVRHSVFPLFIANGITGARDMAGDCDSICPNDAFTRAPVVRSWQQDIERGTLIGPRLVVASALFEGEQPSFPGSYSIHSTNEARQKVQLAKAHGADFIKVLPSLSRDQYMAIVDEAAKQGMYVVGHVPMSVSAADVSEAGQRSIEHMDDLLGRMSYPSCTVNPDSVAARRSGRRFDFYRLLVGGYDAARCRSLFTTFVKNRTWRVPTLIVERTMLTLELGDTSVVADSRTRFMPRELREGWKAFARSEARHYSFEDSTAVTSLLSLDGHLVGQMHRAGVQLLAGTDEPAPFVMPGFSLHDELGLLVKAGLTPIEALRTATINPARFVGATDSLGVVAQGKIADLLLLNADPLIDIHNTTRIAAVVANGRFFDRAALDRMLQSARDH